MRIRTIKPEFFSHEAMSAIEAEAALLALGLLCYADDEGFFNANPKLIQAAVMPLRETSMTIQGILMELSRIGFIEIRKSEEKQIGWVKNFDKHQVISRPRESELRKVFEASVNDQGVIMEPSRTNHGGMEGNGKEQGTGKARARQRRNDHGSILPSEQPEPLSSRLLRLNLIPVPHARQENTRWMAREVQAVRDAGLLELSEVDFAEAAEVMRAFYAAKISEADRYRFARRTTLPILLNNWASELDKARGWWREREKENQGRL